MTTEYDTVATEHDISHFDPPAFFVGPRHIDPAEIPWLFLKKPGGHIGVFEPGDSQFKLCVTSPKIQAGLWRALPGEMYWMDIHPDSDEFWYVISGVSTFWLPDVKELYEVPAGQFFYVPGNMRHQTINRSPEPLLVLFASAPVTNPAHH
jgi:mannose-6-phosphate isomerase-like protein (cupin superfamily)